MPNIFLNHLPHTEFGAKLELTAEQEEKCRVVYKASSENKNICAFHSLWNPDEKYPDDCYIVPLRSTYDGLSDEYANGTCFINISKSTYDPKYIISGWKYDVSWIEVIRRAYAAGKVNYSCSTCCAQNLVIDIRNNNQFTLNCGGNIYGAHVLMNETMSKEVKEWGNVFLLPLCNNHNTYDKNNNEKYHCGTGYYMKLNRPMKAVKLKGYMKKPKEGTLPEYPR